MPSAGIQQYCSTQAEITFLKFHGVWHSVLVFSTCFFLLFIFRMLRLGFCRLSLHAVGNSSLKRKVYRVEKVYPTKVNSCVLLVIRIPRNLTEKPVP